MRHPLEINDQKPGERMILSEKLLRAIGSVNRHSGNQPLRGQRLLELVLAATLAGCSGGAAGPVTLLEDFSARQVIPVNNRWNVDASSAPLDANSQAYIDWISGRTPQRQVVARRGYSRLELSLTMPCVLLGAVVRMLGVEHPASNVGSIGLHRWEMWTHRERIYALTVIPIAAVVFGIVFHDHFATLLRTSGWVGLLTVPTGLLWGMVQEFIYRGLLQTELARRLGGLSGVLLTNLVFTFGPLHFNYFGFGTDSGPRWGMFAAIFGIGLLFGVLYRRSGNLWIPALMHGIWPLNMT